MDLNAKLFYYLPSLMSKVYRKKPMVRNFNFSSILTIDLIVVGSTYYQRVALAS